eukprot:g32323.t1
MADVTPKGGKGLLVLGLLQRFKQSASGAPTAPVAPVPSFTAPDVRSGLINSRNAMGLDRVPGHALRSCADQLVEVFTDTFNISLLQAKIPLCFKKTTIIPVPKKAHATCLNDHCPVT